MALAALPVVGAHAGLLVTYDLAAHPVLFLSMFALAAAAMALAAHRLRGVTASLALPILLVAALLRLLLIPLPPTLSDDLLRYVWDGRVAAAGANPYLLAPDSPELEPLRDGLWERLPHRGVATVYPPLALTLFSIAARLPAPGVAVKLLLALADLVTCGVLLALARRLGVPQSRAVWYAWSPLATLEVAGMGHVDALGVAAAALAVLFLARRPAAAGASAFAAAASIAAKLVPVVALPLWARHAPRPGRYLAVALALVAAALAPVVGMSGGLPPGLVTYGVSWEFNGPLYEPLWRAVDRLEIPRAVARTLDRIKERRGEHDFWNRLYPYNYPQLLAKLGLAAGLAVALVLAWRHSDPVAGSGLVFGALLLFSATVYPWYLLWILPWAALCRQRAWRLLSLLLPLAYLPQIAGVALVPWVFAAIWGPFALALAWRPRWSTA